MNKAKTRTELTVPRESPKMKLYKFRPLASDTVRTLASDTDFNRLKEILETGKFYCAKFPDLNDPMEGVYYTEDRAGLIDLFFNEKNSYKICSFSNEEAFSNPIMWGYYANGFKGVAVEIEVRRDEVEIINYVREIPSSEGLNPKEAVKMLTTKLSPWSHEGEYRFLKKDSNHKLKIGEITALYFGDPYEGVANQSRIIKNSKTIGEYMELKNKMSSIAKELGLSVQSVKIENCKVIKNNPR